MTNGNNDGKSAVGSVIGTIVLAVVCIVGGWIARELFPEAKPVENPMAAMAGTPQARQVETEVNIAVPARIPETYIEDGRERLRAYKQLTGAQDGASSEEAALAVRDRFGPFPEEFRNFLAVLDFKRFLSGLQVEKADLGPKAVRLSWAEGQTGADPVKILRLASQTHGARLTPPASLSMPLAQDRPFPEALSLLRGLLEAVLSDAGQTAKN